MPKIGPKPPIFDGLRIKFTERPRTSGIGRGYALTSIRDPRLFFAAPGPLGASLFAELKHEIVDKYTTLKLEVPDLSPLDRAFERASLAHAGQFRESGEPYIHHPLELAWEMVKEGWLEVSCLTAALLHDSIEDTAEKSGAQRITVNQIREEFGEEVATLVDGLTKLRKIGRSKEIREVESFKKLIEFTSKDIRIGIIKLFDRLINSRTFVKLPADRAEKNARETLGIYVPLAYGFGMWRVANELEQNSFRILDKEGIEQIEDAVGSEVKKNQRKVGEVLESVGMEIHKRSRGRYKVRIEYQANPTSEIYRNYHGKTELSFEDDLHTFVIEAAERDCYQVIGILHGIYNHIPGSFCDYISNPRLNRYRALHTVVFVPGVGDVMFKVLSPDMQRLAEWGILTGYSPKDPHWHKFFGDKYPWFKELVSYLREHEIFSEVDIQDLTRNAVFNIQVFTIAGDLLSLQVGATTTDFAYRIHTEVGWTAVGARVHRRRNILIDRKMSLELQDSDHVEIKTEKDRRPVLSDLRKATTRSAKAAIRSHLRTLSKEVAARNGRADLEKFMTEGVEMWEEGEGRRTKVWRKCYLQPKNLNAVRKNRGQKIKVFSKIFEALNSLLPKEYRGKKIRKARDLFYLIGIGVFSSEEVVRQLIKFMDEQHRIMRKPRIIKMRVETADRVGVMRDITTDIANLRLNLVPEDTEFAGGIARVPVRVRFYTPFERIQLRNILNSIGKIIN